MAANGPATAPTEVRNGAQTGSKDRQRANKANKREKYGYSTREFVTAEHCGWVLLSEKFLHNTFVVAALHNLSYSNKASSKAAVSVAGRFTNEYAHDSNAEIRLRCIAPSICVLCQRSSNGTSSVATAAPSGCSSDGTGAVTTSEPGRRGSDGTGSAATAKLDGCGSDGTGTVATSELDGCGSDGTSTVATSESGCCGSDGTGTAAASEPSGCSSNGAGTVTTSERRLSSTKEFC